MSILETGRTSSAFLVSKPLCCYDDFVDIDEILKKIRDARSPLARQLTMVGLITRVLEERGKPAPVLIGGLALSYYSREVYFTSDIDLAYADREALDAALIGLGFVKKGRYWIQKNIGELVREHPTLRPYAEARIRASESRTRDPGSLHQRRTPTRWTGRA